MILDSGIFALLVVSSVLLCSASACRTESGEEAYKRIKGNDVYEWHARHIVRDYWDAVESAGRNERNPLTEPYWVLRQLKDIEQKRAEYPPVATRFDSLIGLFRKWPVRTSEGVVYVDTCTGEIVKESIKRSRWATLNDLITQRYPEFRLDTLSMTWVQLHSDYLGGDLAVPSYYIVRKTEDDSSLSIDLRYVDTTGARYHVPSLFNAIQITAVRTTLSFEAFAKSKGIQKRWTDMDEIESEWVTRLNARECRFSALFDSTRKILALNSRSWDLTGFISSDTTIRLETISPDKPVNIYFYSRQRRISGYGHGQIIWYVVNSFVPSPRH